MVLFILAAVSGTGKGTVGRALMARNPDLKLSVSHTTRAPRVGEREGVEYHFTDHDAFRAGIEAGGYVEWAEYVGNLYGTSRRTIEDARAAGHGLLFDIEVKGAAQIVEAYPDEAVSVFLLPPSWAELADRLRKRGTNDEADIARRLSRGREELREARWFDHLVVNDTVERAVDELESIYRSAKTRTAGRLELLERLRAEVA